ncbi:hypothetical protein [Escherichia coli]|uniref:hypothetical protein n=1 Tax=Escherichia coli TaxID=562 RepID=UPI0013BA502F|nr:hypothetical protein [Escherichia coli]NEM01869.1 hypothetical protein [Escherichia coli]
MQTFLTRFFVFVMTNINTALARHPSQQSWKGPFTHAQPEQQTNRTSWRFVHGWRGYISKGCFLVGGPSEDILKTKAFNLVWQEGELRFARLLGPILNETT